MKNITILGSTGTIGINTLDVIKQHHRDFTVQALSANTHVTRLHEQCREWQPRYAVMADEDKADELQTLLQSDDLETEVLSGTEGLCKIASLPETDMVMAGIVGAAGLLPGLAAAQAGKTILLANKEALVMSGSLFMETVQRHNARLLPIDSEHNAVFQCLCGDSMHQGVRRILLTASGGPFLHHSEEQLHRVTPEQACAHPNWVMGRKISVDSATMMNKGLEVIEACRLFAISPDQVEVLIHPQSIIHSLVEYIDGSSLAQLGNPDMRVPIAHALGWPRRIESGVAGLDLLKTGKLEFFSPDRTRFPCLRLAYEAMLAGGTTTTILNAANEVAVAEFLDGKLAFVKIAAVIEETLSRFAGREAGNLDMILEDDLRAREVTHEAIAALSG